MPNTISLLRNAHKFQLDIIHYSTIYNSTSTLALKHIPTSIPCTRLQKALLINRIPEAEMLSFSYDAIIVGTILLFMHSQGNSVSLPKPFLKNIDAPLTRYPRFGILTFVANRYLQSPRLVLHVKCIEFNWILTSGQGESPQALGRKFKSFITCVTFR